MDASNGPDFWKRAPLLLAAGLFFARLVGLISTPVEALRGYGDFLHYYLVYGLPGWPFFDYWVEYPPIFPFIAAALNVLARGQEHVFTYLLNFLLLLANAGSVYLFTCLVARLFAPEDRLARAGMYLLVMVSLPYQWWYFDPLVVFFLLLGLYLILEGRIYSAGAALCLGVALKLFPVLAVLAAWGRVSWKRLAGLTAISLLPVVLLYAFLWLVAPDFTLASLRSQAGKGSWETVWALLDGNIRTGSFGSAEERLDPARAGIVQGNPAVIPPIASLMVFGGVGLWALSRFKPRTGPSGRRQSIALVGFAWSLFVLWSPGWSPQWVLYLLPLALLALPGRQAFLFALVLVLVNLLEWPVMLSRGFFWALWMTIPLRTLILGAFAAAFYRAMREEAHSIQAASQAMV